MTIRSRIKRATLATLALFAAAAALSAAAEKPAAAAGTNSAASAAGAATIAGTPVTGTQAGTPSESTSVQSRIFSAETAIRAGLPALAIEFLQPEAQNKALPNADRDRILTLLAGAQLACGDYADAAATLADISGNSPQKRLRAALVAIAQNRENDAEELLDGLDDAAFPQEEKSWFFLARAVASGAQGDAESAEKNFAEAEKNAATASVRAHMEFLHSWTRVTHGGSDSPAVDLDELRAARDAARGTPEFADRAKLHIVAIAKTGDRAGALSALREATPVPEKNAAEFALLEGLLSDDLAGTDARDAFRRVIAARPSRALQIEAFAGLFYGVSLLRRESRNEEAILAANAIEAFLSALPADDAVRDAELYTRAHIALFIGNEHLAQALSGELLSSFPASPYAQDALRILVSAAVRQKEYRRAVTFLNRLRETDISSASRLQTDILIADCNFLSGDWRLAAGGYARAVQAGTLSGDALGVVFFQQAFSHIRNGDVASAAELLDSESAKSVPAPWTMRTECVVIEALFQANLSENAAARAKRFLARTDLLPDFRMRILWIQAVLAIDLKDAETALSGADMIAELAENLGDDASAALRERAPELVSRSILLKARALFLVNDDEGGLKLLADLRERYPDSVPAAVSWLEEGRRFNDLGKPSRALVCYETLLERYGDKEEFAEYAAIAVFEAAQASATIGRPDDAVKQMQKLVSLFPRSPLVFYARMRQADFFRILNDFDSALAVYDNLLATETDRAELRVVEIRRADALRAIAARSENDESARTTFLEALGRAESAYERLFSLPEQDLSLKAEAGFKWAAATEHSVPAGTGKESAGTAEARKKAEQQAIIIYWRAATETLEETRSRGTAALGNSGGYWISRCMFALAAIYERNGDFESARNAYRKIAEWSAEGLVPGKRYAEWRLDKILEK